MFDTSVFNNVSSDHLNEVDSNESYPLIIYGYGNSILATKLNDFDSRGGFFIDADKLGADGSNQRSEYINALLAAGWQADERTISDKKGTKIPGFWKFDAELAIITWRKRWEASMRDSNTVEFHPFPDGREGFSIREQLAKKVDIVSGKIQILVVVRGLENLRVNGSANPPAFVLTLGGVRQITFTKEILPAFMRGMLQPASAKVGGKALPLRTFYLHMSPAVDSNGKNVFTKASEAKDAKPICKPAIVGLPNPANETELLAAFGRYYVGTELLAQSGPLDSLFVLNQEWARAWDSIAPQPAAVVAEDAQPAPAVNAVADLIMEAGV